jgi:hypothetical protein
MGQQARLGRQGIEREAERIRTLLGDYRLSVAISAFLNLPGLRGFWPMSSFNESGNAYDLSGQGRILTYNGNPTYNFAGLVPYIDLDGTGDYLSRADEAGLDILGTESYVVAAARGLTLGGWFWLGASGAVQSLITKEDGAVQRSYFLTTNVIDQIVFRVTTDGSTLVAVTHGTALVTSTWYFLVGRFDPSAELKIWVNRDSTPNAVGIPASIFNGNAAFVVGGRSGGGALLTGRASLCFLCACALSDTIIGALFQQTRVLFGV